MTTKTNAFNRLLSIFLCLAILLAYVPASVFYAEAVPAENRAADPATMDSWKEFFLPADGSLSTENAGGVWTDKSVLTDNTALPGITQKDAESFLVALSAIASNKTVTGMSSTPSDTMLVLDVSGSMKNYGSALVEAANEAIDALLNMNSYNRVGVVVYSGTRNSSTNNNAAVLLLPLGRYTTTSYTSGSDPVGRYLQYSSSSVSVRSAVRVEDTNSRPSTYGSSKEITGATYIQKGIMRALEQFTAESNQVTITDPQLGTIQRKPVLVLMSDGAPTLGSGQFSNPGQFQMGDGSNTSAALGFVSQLTAAYAKSQIETKYGTDCLFYTLGMGVDNDSVAKSVLDPANSSTAISDFWTRYNDAAATDKIVVQEGNKDQDEVTVTKIGQTLEKNYVDRYFSTGSGNLSQGLQDAFKDIVGTIQIQSKYYPTLISESEDLSGYISFVDRIGEYMRVTDVKGILINNQLFSGAELAKNFAAGSNGGSLGTAENPADLGNEMVWAVMARLGLASADEARTLIGLAYEYGQLSYTSAGEYSNYIGWYANEKGQFLGFWHEGITTMPDPADPSLNADTRPAYIMKSYGYLGAVDEEHGVAASDMMYATVQVREAIATGEQTVIFAIPAALIPVVTYNVTLDEKGTLTDLTATGATEPIRLVYEVALDGDINPFNVKELVSESYLAANTNADGSVNFYTNQYEVNGTVGYGKVNTYSYFNPSRQNDRYYYLENALIYTDQAGTLYTGTQAPSGQLYRQHISYQKSNGVCSTKVGYHLLTAEALETALPSEEGGTWYIPQGNVRGDYESYAVYKGGSLSPNAAGNLTGTLSYANMPFVDTEGHSLGDTGYDYVVGATLGNNGRITLEAQTGIHLSKTMSDGSAGQAFTFLLSNLSDESDSTSYPARLVLADGSEELLEVAFENGQAAVSLEPGQNLYIGGMTAGQQILVQEQEEVDYIVQSVNAESVSSVTLQLQAGVLLPAAFVNGPRAMGNLTVAKEVEHSFGELHQLPADLSFTIRVTLSGIGTANAQLSVKQTGQEATTLMTDEKGSFLITLKHNEQLEIFNLPEGTLAQVVEEAPGLGFTPSYWDNGQEGDGVVTVEGNNTVSVIVVNGYEASQVPEVNITVSGTKVLEGRDWQEDDSFTFQLQRQLPDNSWSVLGTATVTGADAEKTFDFGDVMASEIYDAAGSYYYRVVELQPEGFLGGIRYDKTVHAFTVLVGDADMDGSLEIRQINAQRPETTHVSQPEADLWQVTVDFLNTYTVEGEASVTIDLNKIVENPANSPLAQLSGFTFGLYDLDGQLVQTSAPTTERGFARMSIEFTEPGTYHFLVQEIQPDPIPAGWTYSEEAWPVTVVVTHDGQGGLAATISQGQAAAADASTSLSLSFTNRYVPGAALLDIDFVSKSLSGRAMKAGEFTFQVTDRDGNPILVGTNTADGTVEFPEALVFESTGIYFFNISEIGTDGNGIVMDKTVYQVTVTVTDAGGKLSASYILANVADEEIVFRNTYTAQPVSYIVSGSKILVGRALLNDEFAFLLVEAGDAQGTPVSGGMTLQARNYVDGSFRFPEITYTQAGTYFYVVTEQAIGGSYGIRYDDTRYVVRVDVVDDGVGSLKIDQVLYTLPGGDAEAITFVNEYIPAPAQTQIPGLKVLEGQLLSGGQFSFQLFASNEGWTEGELLQTVKNSADGSFLFPGLELEEKGTYYFLVKEADGGQTINGVTYDDSVYRVRVVVTDDLRGQLHASVLVLNAYDIPQESIRFVNVYRTEDTETVILRGEKTLIGKDFADGDFRFNLYEANSDFVIDGALIQWTANAGKWFSFQLDYSQEDVGNTYYYVAREENGGLRVDGIAYDASEFHIAVSVFDDGMGGIGTETVIYQNGEPVEQLSFVNTYIADSTDLVLAGQKVLTGDRLLQAGEFSFDLFLTDSAFETKQLLQSAANAEDGSFGFEPLVLEEAGVYHFLITENADNALGGVTYDKSQYRITVIVSDNGRGQLVSQVEILRDAEPADAIRFENSYKAAPVTLPLAGLKVLEGAELQAEQFRFLLEQADESFTAFELLQSAYNSADGTFTFEDLVFTEAGVYFFRIREDLENPQERTTYDESVYLLTVQVADDAQGSLRIVEMALEKDGEPAEAIRFVNRYTPKPADVTVEILVDKVVESLGKETIGPEGFQFTLEGREVLSVLSDETGKASFLLTFTEEDIGKTLVYRLSEVNGGREFVTYDESVYEFRFTVGLDENNSLTVAVEKDGRQVEKAAAQFVNLFEDIGNPGTGDTGSLGLWLALLFVSGGALGMTAALGRKKKAE